MTLLMRMRMRMLLLLAMAGQEQEQEQEVVLKHDELFRYLHDMLKQIEEGAGEPDLELRETISSLRKETTRAPTVDKRLGDLEIAQELDKLSAKLDCIEQTIAPSLLDPQVQRLLSATADLWIPTITASSDERISIASASNSEIPNKDNIVVAKESEE